ncbi:hypothetical protein Q5692_13810 [Microcoleus sp. C2C3]|uniref:hypothetical protein n=1 Tax=unclassified Microcoleus TaxID=2642155 RepID=UPI002FD77881
MLPSFPIGDNNHIKRSTDLLFDGETQIPPAPSKRPGEESSLSSPDYQGDARGFWQWYKSDIYPGF